MAEDLPLRRAFVTGGTGFVGARLCASLVAAQVSVVASSRSQHQASAVRWVQLELPDGPPPDELREVDVVFHLAARAHAVAISRADGSLYERINEHGSIQMARAAVTAGVRRFVLVSSVKAMRAPGDFQLAETDPGVPVDPYGLSKRRAEMGVRAVAEGSGMDVVVLRPALLYGPGVKGNLATLLDSLARGRRPPLPDVQNRRSLLGLVDFVEAAKTCAIRPEASGRTYVLTDGQAYSTRRIVDGLAGGLGVDATPRFRIPLPVLSAAARVGDLATRATGRRAPFDTAALDKLVGNADYASEAIRAELGFMARVTLEDEAAEIARSALAGSWEKGSHGPRSKPVTPH